MAVTSLLHRLHRHKTPSRQHPPFLGTRYSEHSFHLGAMPSRTVDEGNLGQNFGSEKDMLTLPPIPADTLPATVHPTPPPLLRTHPFPISN